MMVKILKIMISPTLMRKIKHCTLAMLWLKVTTIAQHVWNLGYDPHEDRHHFDANPDPDRWIGIRIRIRIGIKTMLIHNNVRKNLTVISIWLCVSADWSCKGRLVELGEGMRTCIWGSAVEVLFTLCRRRRIVKKNTLMVNLPQLNWASVYLLHSKKRVRERDHESSFLSIFLLNLTVSPHKPTTPSIKFWRIQYIDTACQVPPYILFDPDSTAEG